MNISGVEWRDAVARNVSVTNDSFIVDLDDRRTVAVPRLWFPRLANGTAAERAEFPLIGNGTGVYLLGDRRVKARSR